MSARAPRIWLIPFTRFDELDNAELDGAVIIESSDGGERGRGWAASEFIRYVTAGDAAIWGSASEWGIRPQRADDDGDLWHITGVPGGHETSDPLTIVIRPLPEMRGFLDLEEALDVAYDEDLKVVIQNVRDDDDDNEAA